MRFSSLLVLGGVLLFTLAAAAGAAFPGENGRIVFVSDRDGNAEIYSMRPDGSDPLRLTVNEVTDVRPAWSPDGRLIAFARERNGIPQLWVTEADGSDQRQAASAPPGFGDSEPAWSPNGKFLAFTRRAAPAGPEEPPGSGDVYTMRADGRHVRNLTDSPGQDDFEPTWSPGGKRIAFDSDRGDAGGVDVWDMNARNGRKQRRLTNVPGFDGGPNYSPDGCRIAFDSERTGGGDVYVMTADGASPMRLTESDASDIVTGWSPDGAMIAFSSNRDAPTAQPVRYEVYVMGADGSDERNLSRSLASDDDDPDWQPLGKKADEDDASVITNARNGNLLSVPRVGLPAGEGGHRPPTRAWRARSQRGVSESREARRVISRIGVLVCSMGGGGPPGDAGAQTPRRATRWCEFKRQPVSAAARVRERRAWRSLPRQDLEISRGQRGLDARRPRVPPSITTSQRVAGRRAALMTYRPSERGGHEAHG